MPTQVKTIEEYISQIPEDKKDYFLQLRQSILKNLPTGFTEQISYNMPGYVVPLATYPDGYHCKKGEPLPFIHIAAQKNHIALYHMGIYAMPELLEWFQQEFPKHSTAKLDMGKSCIRFKKPDTIPFQLIGELCKKISVQQWIDTYEKLYKK